MYTKRHLSLVNILLSMITTGLIMMILWQEADPRAFMIFVFCLIVAETFVQMRWRISIACPHCGFNPLVYMKSPEKAAARVSEFFEAKKLEPSFYLSKNPLLKVARQQAQAKKKSLSHRRTIALREKTE